jgi:ribosome biogenesis GTPase A
LYEQEPTAALLAIEKLKVMVQIVNQAGITPGELEIPWDTANNGRSGEECVEDTSQWPCNFVYLILDVMVAFPSENNDRTFVDMKGLPVANRGEVAFIGRSNVGKSCLVNMVRYELVLVMG